MWKENLPDGCPPNGVLPRAEKVFRFIEGTNIVESDFICYALLPRNKNKRYTGKILCKALSVSVYNKLDSAINIFKEAKERGLILGNFVAEIELKEDHGVCELDDTSGHIGLWLYKTWKHSDYTILSLHDLNGN
jgi:hypothetical protein